MFDLLSVAYARELWMLTRIHWVYQLILQRIYNYYIKLKNSYSMAPDMGDWAGGTGQVRMDGSYLNMLKDGWHLHLSISLSYLYYVSSVPFLLPQPASPFRISTRFR